MAPRLRKVVSFPSFASSFLRFFTNDATRPLSNPFPSWTSAPTTPVADSHHFVIPDIIISKPSSPPPSLPLVDIPYLDVPDLESDNPSPRRSAASRVMSFRKRRSHPTKQSGRKASKDHLHPDSSSIRRRSRVSTDGAPSPMPRRRSRGQRVRKEIVSIIRRSFYSMPSAVTLQTTTTAPPTPPDRNLDEVSYYVKRLGPRDEVAGYCKSVTPPKKGWRDVILYGVGSPNAMHIRVHVRVVDIESILALATMRTFGISKGAELYLGSLDSDCRVTTDGYLRYWLCNSEAPIKEAYLVPPLFSDTCLPAIPSYTFVGSKFDCDAVEASVVHAPPVVDVAEAPAASVSVNVGVIQTATRLKILPPTPVKHIQSTPIRRKRDFRGVHHRSPSELVLGPARRETSTE